MLENITTGEVRDISFADVPPHKKNLWRAYVPPPPAPPVEAPQEPPRIDRIAELEAQNAALQNQIDTITQHVEDQQAKTDEMISLIIENARSIKDEPLKDVL